MASLTEHLEESDSYVTIGSAFKLYETDEEIAKAKDRKAKDSYVLDKQGRRRFHGAFTGGFSAGYYNTVGTKEGWSPATFSSSRKSKETLKRQRPEDFMDEEDLDVFGIAPRQVTTRDQFTANKTTDIVTNKPSVIPGGPLLHDIVLPARNTVGSSLLRGMGWREGQGVGPKVARNEPDGKVYGCSLPSSENEFLFPPHDIAPWQFNIKNDVHGIGYKGMNEQGILSNQTYSDSLYGMRGQAFGVGALEEDDDDIYSQDTMTSYSHTLVNDNELNSSLKYGWTGEHLTESWSLNAFVKVKQVNVLKFYAPPKLPVNFVAHHVFTTRAPLNVPHVPLSANHREHVIEGGTNKSVFDYVSLADKKRIEQIKQQSTPATNIGQTIVDGNYKPFADNPSKQLRYEEYLKGKRKFNDKGTDHFTEWERKKELDEFSRKARLLKPLSTSLSDKFTKSTTALEEDESPLAVNEEAIEAAHIGMFGVMTREQTNWYPHSVLCKRFNIPNPYPNSDIVGVPTAPPRPSKTINFETSTNTQTKAISVEKSEREEAKNDEKIEEKQVTVSRPPMETFLSIFATNSDYDSFYIKKDYQTNIKWTDLSLRTPLPIPPIQQSTPTEQHTTSDITTNVKEDALKESSSEIFGPSLPPDLADYKHERHSHKHKHRTHHKKAKHKRKHSS